MQTLASRTTNLGARGRQELALPHNVIMTAGIAVEKSWLDGVQHSFTYALGGHDARRHAGLGRSLHDECRA